MDVLELRIGDLSRAGSGVARGPDGRVVFVPYTAPGDLVRARVVDQVKDRYAQAELLEVLEPSPVRSIPPCHVFGKCGGCSWQHLPYEVQWKAKLNGVLHAMKRAGIQDSPLIEELPAERVWEYRNRIQLRGFKGEIGFFAAGTNSVVPIDRCDIARPEINAIWEGLRKEGSRFSRPFKVEVEVLPDGEVRKIWNSAHSAGGFRQVHDEQNTKLCRWVEGAVTPGRPLLDLFGGFGNISLSLASKMASVDCVDVRTPAVRPEGVPETFRFHRSMVLPWLIRESAARKAQGSVVPGVSAILDPPREGLGVDFNDTAVALDDLGVDEIVAIGCDTDAWIRDLSRFLRRGWKLERAALLDFFPQTPHVECLALLKL